MSTSAWDRSPVYLELTVSMFLVLTNVNAHQAIEETAKRPVKVSHSEFLIYLTI